MWTRFTFVLWTEKYSKETFLVINRYSWPLLCNPCITTRSKYQNTVSAILLCTVLYICVCTVGYNLFCVLLGKFVGATCPIVMNPPVVVVRYGDDFSVNCTSLTNQTEGMGWESSAGGTDLVKNVTDVSLYIKSVVVWNLSPMCYVNEIDGSQCLQHLPVTVYSKLSEVSKQSRKWFSDNLILLMGISIWTLVTFFL